MIRFNCDYSEGAHERILKKLAETNLEQTPGYGEDHPTLEIFSYDHMEESDPKINRCGLAHLAFEVDDVEETLKRVLENGGGQIGELVTAEYPGGKRAVFVYASDCEGNILELQSWS